jgi:paraquat-inducible protein B
MADTPRPAELPDIPEAVAAPKSTRSIQLVWLIPLVAVLVGGWLAVKAIIEKGPTITISFETAEGLEAGKTKIKFKDVEVGLVSSVVLSEDFKRVIVTADLVKGTERYLAEDTRFWVVRPRITGGDVSGLGTLLSGAYIGVDVGKSGKSGKSTRHFTGLKAAPVFSSDVPGREFVLRSSDIGSLDPGSPVYFRRLQVGQIASYALDKDGKGVTLKLFVNAPYDRYVTSDTRFWHASGFDVTLDASGVKINTQSLVAMLSGGLAFETPADSAALPPAAAGAEFRLFAHRAEAMKTPDEIVMKTVMVFRESVRGLAPGAPVDFRGIVVGEVTAIRVELDPATLYISIPVEVNIYPARLRTRLVTQRAALSGRERREFLNAMMGHGLRAQLRTGNLLTGQLFIALDFFPNAPKIKTTLDGDVFEVHTVPSGMTEIQETIASITKKIQDLPLTEIGTDLRQTLQSANRLIERFDTDLAPEARAAIVDVRKALAATEHALKPESPLQQDARDAMRELARAAQAFRILADYLERHPEALIQGKKEGEK